MRKLLFVGTAALVSANLTAVPSDARRAEAEKEAQAVYEQLTPEECVKLAMMDSPAVDRIGLPKFHWWSEALHGYAWSGMATVFPQSIGRGATFDPELEFRMADAISTEARAKVNLYRKRGLRGSRQCLSLWSPNVNLVRDPRWGRGQETFGEDPYLTGRMGTAFVKGIQGDDPKFLKAVACAKHYAVHSGPEPKRHEFNVDLDKRDLYEYYLQSFRPLVTEGKVESIMGAYSAVNGVPCCASKFLLQDVLRDEWGFRGSVVSDVGAVDDIAKNHKYRANTFEGCLAAIEGGLDLCSEGTYSHLRGPMREGKIKKELLKKPLMHLLTTRALLGELSAETKTPWDHLGGEVINCEAHKAIAREIAEKSAVLVKNNGILPLDQKKYNSIGVWGCATDQGVLSGNYSGRAPINMTLLSGLMQEAAPGVCVDFRHEGDVIVTGFRVADEGEEHDRKDLKLQQGYVNELRNDRKKHPNTPVIGVVYGGSAADIRDIMELCDAVIVAFYPGEQGGTALARIICGKVSPSGRLPITYYKDVEKLPDFEDYRLPGHTYRYGQENVLFPFGYGLSYTSFAYANEEVKVKGEGEQRTVKVSAEVKNTGKVAGDEVVQLYVRSPKGSGDRRIHHLEGFTRVNLKPGETKTVSFTLKPEQLMQFGMDGKQSLAKGSYTFFVGGGQPGYAENVVSSTVRF